MRQVTTAGERVGLANYVLYVWRYRANAVSIAVRRLEHLVRSQPAPASSTMSPPATMQYRARSCYGRSSPAVSATAGYDLATGCGSVQVNNLSRPGRVGLTFHSTRHPYSHSAPTTTSTAQRCRLRYTVTSGSGTANRLRRRQPDRPMQSDRLPQGVDNFARRLTARFDGHPTAYRWLRSALQPVRPLPGDANLRPSDSPPCR